MSSLAAMIITIDAVEQTNDTNRDNNYVALLVNLTSTAGKMGGKITIPDAADCSIHKSRVLILYL